ncbi:MAG: RluA family pseudouridine synthase [Tissierellia bacterium]|nr:RluA family pseudouridine synthase [Tissierellia bacterium]
MQKVIIEKNDDGQRLDRFLKKLLPKAPKNLIYKSLRKKNIVVNGKKKEPHIILKTGDEIKIFFSDETIKKFSKSLQEMKSNWPQILYEDNNILLMVKPGNILTHGRGNPKEDDMVKKLISYLQDTNQYHPRKEHSFTPAVCNRLDRNTSGILIGAKNAEALREINTLIAERKVIKKYLALVHGNFQFRGLCKDYLSKDEDKNKVFLGSDGKEILTEFQPLLQNKDFSLVEVHLITGRTHQIRSQCAALGHPILGDKKYGKGKRDDFPRQWLHNHFLGFQEMDRYKNLSNKTFYAKPPKLLEEELIKKFGGKGYDILSRY